MRLILDSVTVKEFLDAGRADARIALKAMGCAGTKVFVEPLASRDGLTAYPQPEGITLWTESSHAANLDGGRVTRTSPGKFVFTGAAVKARCGCGTSISFTAKAIDPKNEKLHKLGEALAGNPQFAHLRAAMSVKKA